MPGELTYARCADSLGLAEDASLSLSRAGRAFLERLFHATLRSSATAWSLDGSAPTTLEPAHLDAMFAPTPAGVHPFQRWLYPDVTHHNAHGGITEAGWLGLWRMLLATEPSAAFQALFALGFATRHGDVGPAAAGAGSASAASGASAAGAAGSGCLVSCDPRAAVVCDVPRKSSPPFTKASVRRIFVVGSKGSGKVRHNHGRGDIWFPLPLCVVVLFPPPRLASPRFLVASHFAAVSISSFVCAPHLARALHLLLIILFYAIPSCSRRSSCTSSARARRAWRSTSEACRSRQLPRQEAVQEGVQQRHRPGAARLPHCSRPTTWRRRHRARTPRPLALARRLALAVLKTWHAYEPCPTAWSSRSGLPRRLNQRWMLQRRRRMRCWW